MMPRLLVLLLSMSLAACITPMPRSARPTTSAVILDTVPVEKWGDNTCGSGALAAVLTHYGDPISEAELNEILPKGKHGGVVSIDLLLETRRRGFDAHLVRGSEELVVRRLQERKPSILMLQVVDMPGDDRDYYHYVVADGYDASKNLIRFQFGDGKSRWVPLAKLAGPWEGAGFATMTVDPLTLESGLRQAVLLEEKGSVDEAIAAYRTLLRRHPDSALAWTNLGNAQANAGAAGEAEASYRKALEIAPADRDALNNLAWLLFTGGRFAEAEPLARAAVAGGGPDPHLALDTLGHILAATGRCAEARDVYGKALESSSIDEATAAPLRAEIVKLEADCASRVGAGDPPMAPPGSFE